MTLNTDILTPYKHIFANDPIIVHAVTNLSDVPSDAIIPQLVIRITIHLENNVVHVHEIPQQFIPGDTLHTDISSAFQAEYQLKDRQSEPEPTLAAHSYNAFRATIQAYVRYLIDGVEYNGWHEDNDWVPQQLVTIIDDVYVLRGGLRPDLRLAVAENPSSAVYAFAGNMTTKPALVQVNDTPCILEAKNTGDTQLYSYYDPSSHAVITLASPNQDIPDNAFLTIEDASPFRHQLLFRNSLGVLETFSVKTLSKESILVSSEQFPVASAATYSPPVQVITESADLSKKIEMSTGYIPRDWAEWFIREVLTAVYVWIQAPTMNPKTGVKTLLWMPVHLKTGEATDMLDETKPQLCEVKFTAMFASEAGI